jgi:hypothetical protein
MNTLNVSGGTPPAEQMVKVTCENEFHYFPGLGGTWFNHRTVQVPGHPELSYTQKYTDAFFSCRKYQDGHQECRWMNGFWNAWSRPDPSQKS